MTQYIKVKNKIRIDCPKCSEKNSDKCENCKGNGYIITYREEEIPLEEAIRRTNAYNNKGY